MRVSDWVLRYYRKAENLKNLRVFKREGNYYVGVSESDSVESPQDLDSALLVEPSGRISEVAKNDLPDNGEVASMEELGSVEPVAPSGVYAYAITDEYGDYLFVVISPDISHLINENENIDSEIAWEPYSLTCNLFGEDSIGFYLSPQAWYYAQRGRIRKIGELQSFINDFSQLYNPEARAQYVRDALANRE